MGAANHLVFAVVLPRQRKNLKEQYFIKIVPDRGDVIHRFAVTRRGITIAAAAAAFVFMTFLAAVAGQIVHARAEVASLRTTANKQKQQLQRVNATTATIQAQLQTVQKQNQQIQQMIGVQSRPPAPHVLQKTSRLSSPDSGPNLDVLAVQTERTAQTARDLQLRVFKVLNVRHLAELARARTIAAIPSIDPVDGAPVIGCFCYRTSPSAEFHPGVDLGADYGDVVRAAAAGTIATTGWDGGYGLKVDIDHGNGYHTWYAHLSRIDVQPGEYVHKGEPIALVGNTGFSTGPHLHYQVMRNGTAIDPAPFLNGVPANVLASLP